MIALALEYGTAPILTLTPLDEQGRFSNYLIHTVVQNPEAVNHLIDSGFFNYKILHLIK